MRSLDSRKNRETTEKQEENPLIRVLYDELIKLKNSLKGIKGVDSKKTDEFFELLFSDADEMGRVFGDLTKLENRSDQLQYVQRYVDRLKEVFISNKENFVPSTVKEKFLDMIKSER